MLAEELEKIGIGKLKVERRGGKTRIEWNFNRKSVGMVAVELASKLEEAGDQIDVDEEEDELRLTLNAQAI